MNEPAECPCGSGIAYDNCCRRIHRNALAAETAEQLMRARYSAFVLAKHRFLLKTQHPDFRKPEDRKTIKENIKHTQWLGLNLIATEKGQAQDNQGVVEFIASYMHNGQQGRHHERSLFVRQQGRWYYREPIPFNRDKASCL